MALLAALEVLDGGRVLDEPLGIDGTQLVGADPLVVAQAEALELDEVLQLLALALLLLDLGLVPGALLVARLAAVAFRPLHRLNPSKMAESLVLRFALLRSTTCPGSQ